MKNFTWLVVAIVLIALVIFGVYYFKSEPVTPTPAVDDIKTSTTKDKVVSFSKIQPSLRIAQGGVTVVSYTSKGFAPFVTEITVGETVRFTNNRSDKALRIVSTSPENSDLFYPGFSSSKSIAKGQSFDLPFTKVGAWSYTNLNDDTQQGVIIVTE